MVYKILLVEDEATMRRLIGMLLARQGHEVIEAENGARVVELAQEHQPDLILLDIMMPVVDGFEAMRQVRSTPGIDDIPIIILSAKSQVEDRVEGLRLGADDYLVKPADPDELMARIEAVMARSLREARRRKGSVFGIVGAKGGVGATTVAVNLGLNFHVSGRSAMVVDLHLAFGDVATYLGLEPVEQSTANLAILPPNEIDRRTIEQTVVRHSSGMPTLLSPTSVPSGILFSAEHLMAIIEQCAYMARHVFVDLPRDPDILEVVAEQLSGLILVMGDEPASMHAAERVAGHLGQIGLHNRLSVLLVHRHSPDHQYLNANKVTERLSCLFLGSIPARPDLYLRAEYAAVPVVLQQQGSSEQVVYEELGAKLANYADILDQFRKKQVMESRFLA